MMTISQIMKLVVFAGAACACVVPALEVSGVFPVFTPFAIIIFESMAIPVAWALLSLVLLKNGPRKDVIIIAFVLTAVSVALGLFVWIFLAEIFPALTMPQAGTLPAPPRTVVAAVGATILMMSGAWFFLLGRLFRLVRGSSRTR